MSFGLIGSGAFGGVPLGVVPDVGTGLMRGICVFGCVNALTLPNKLRKPDETDAITPFDATDFPPAFVRVWSEPKDWVSPVGNCCRSSPVGDLQKSIGPAAAVATTLVRSRSMGKFST